MLQSIQFGLLHLLAQSCLAGLLSQSRQSILFDLLRLLSLLYLADQSLLLAQSCLAGLLNQSRQSILFDLLLLLDQSCLADQLNQSLL